MVSDNQARTNEQIIHEFYTAFSEHNADKMSECYAENVHFLDPAFGNLYSEKVIEMWTLLIKKSKGNLTIKHHNVWADDEYGGCNWQAEYYFGKRKITNNIEARFRFKDGKIIEHSDHFSLYKWSQQAFGLTGLLIGWTPFFKNKIRSTSRKMLGL